MKTKLMFELKRKAVHILALLFLAIYIIVRRYSGKGIALLSLTLILILFLILDYFRIIRKKKIPFFHIFWRESERSRLGGNVYFIMGTVVSFAIFDFWIALTALLMTVFGDTAAALFGIKFGKIFLKSNKNKTWEGATAELVVNLLIGLLLLHNLAVAIGMALAATLVETFFTKVDDNFAVPIISGFIGELLNLVIRL